MTKDKALYEKYPDAREVYLDEIDSKFPKGDKRRGAVLALASMIFIAMDTEVQKKVSEAYIQGKVAGKEELIREHGGDALADTYKMLQKKVEAAYNEGYIKASGESKENDFYQAGREDGVRGFVQKLREDRIWETTKEIKVMAETFLKESQSSEEEK